MLLTVRDVEEELQLGRTRTYELLRSGELPVIRVGRLLRVPREAPPAQPYRSNFHQLELSFCCSLTGPRLLVHPL
jgi:excisionase family DNA binding protein